MRIVLVLYRDDLNVGGSLRVVETLANALDPRFVEAHIVFTYGEAGPVSSKTSVPCHFVGSHGPRDLAGWMRARRVFDAIDPDIVHFHNPVYWLHAALAGKRFKKLFHLHGPFFPDKMSPVERLLMSQTGRLADATVCITREVRDLALRRGWSTPDRTWTVNNGIDCRRAETAPGKYEARRALGLPEDALVIGVVSRLAWYKGCNDAVRILARLNPRWHVVFCGDGPLRPYLTDIAAQLGVSHRTHFTGMLADMSPAYAAMDAFLFLSRLEPFGLVIAEAMASRVPVFGLGGEGAYRDALYPLITQENAVFVERASPGDYFSPEPAGVIGELAEKIDRFGEDPEAHRTVTDRAQRWVRERFDARVLADAMTEVYELVLRHPAGAPK
jgi:glycosyltransferase involved in cell wall biosynthesis